jgi:aspartate kinase
MLFAHGFLRRVFEIFERHQTSVDVVATSEVSVSVTIDDPARLDALLVDLRSLGDVSIERNRGIIAVVGAGIGDAGGAMGRALIALGDTKVHMMSLSATGINLTVIVEGDEVTPAMQRLHQEFFGGGLRHRREGEART